MSWMTQPVCYDCWRTVHPEEIPHRQRPQLRTTVPCCLCGKDTHDGIWARANPMKVPYPYSDATAQ